LSNTDEQLPAIGCCSRTSSTVGVCSTARRKRNQDASGIRRALRTGISARSSTIIPKPLLCRSRSVIFSTCSSCDSEPRRWLLSSDWFEFLKLCSGNELRTRNRELGTVFLHRTQSKRPISIPADAAEIGSSASLASTSPQTSPRRVAWVSAVRRMLVRPEEADPQISVRQPRGRPPVSASSSRMPLETISGAGRTSRRDAGVIDAASFGSASSPASRAALERTGKIKGRPRAADENTGEADICPQNFREQEGRNEPRRFVLFSFYSPIADSGLLSCSCQAALRINSDIFVSYSFYYVSILGSSSDDFNIIKVIFTFIWICPNLLS
jgi:hypothetical protein